MVRLRGANWCKLPCHSLEGFQHIWIFQLFNVRLESCVFLVCWFFLTKVEGHQQVVVTSSVWSWKICVQAMFTPDRKSMSSLECNQSGCGVVQVHLLGALWWPKVFANTRLKVANSRSLESSLICVIFAEGSTNALPVFINILGHFYIPVSLHNKSVFQCLIIDTLWLVIEFFCFVVIVWHWRVHLYYCDVERGCHQAMVMSLLETGQHPLSDIVHNVLINKKSSAMLVFIFSTEENLVSFPCCCFFKVLPSHFTVQGCSICTCPFCVLVT